LVFSVPTYIKVLGVYNNTLYAGTMLDNRPKLYYCNGSANNPSDWHIDTGFSDVLNFTGPFGSVDTFAAYNSNVESPVGYWKFEEGQGEIAGDSSGNDHNGTVYGGNWTNGISGKALEFDGRDDYVEVSDSSQLNPSLITVEAWVNLKGFSTDPNPVSMIISHGIHDQSPGFYGLYSAAFAHIFIFQIAEAASQGFYYTYGTTVPSLGVWYHVAGTYDGSTMRIYVNGVLEGETVANVVRTNNTNNMGFHVGSLLLPGWEYWFNGTIDEVKIYDYARTPEEIRNDYYMGTKMYVASGSTIYSYDATGWNQVKTYDDVYAFLDMQVYNGKLYFATRDQGWRKPFYQGGTGFSGRVIEFDGENWTTVLDHDYWIYSLGVYDNKLYVGTANEIFTYNGTSWEPSFNATESAYYAMCFENYDDKIYVGMGNGYIFADPAPPKTNPETIIVPEFPSTAILASFMAVTVLAAVLTRKKRARRLG